MSATFVSGDLFKHPGLDGLAHRCNCAGAMGAGYGGLDWRDVRAVLERVGQQTSVELIVFEEFKP